MVCAIARHPPQQNCRSAPSNTAVHCVPGGLALPQWKQGCSALAARRDNNAAEFDARTVEDESSMPVTVESAWSGTCGVARIDLSQTPAGDRDCKRRIISIPNPQPRELPCTSTS